MGRLAGLVLLVAVGLSAIVGSWSVLPVDGTGPDAGSPAADPLSAANARLGCVTPPPTPAPTVKPTPTIAPSPGPYRPLGVDASVWNGSVNWARVRDAGVRFAYVKATQGTSLTDVRYARNIARARARGLSVGSYHFYDYRRPGRAQADRFVAAMAQYGGLVDSLPPAVDVECFDPFGPANRSYVRKELRRFADRVLELTGRPVMVYTGRWSWREVTGNAATFGDLPLWIACWTCRSLPVTPPGWTDWLFWQTGSMRIPGIGRMGRSEYWGTDADLLALRADRTGTKAAGTPN